MQKALSTQTSLVKKEITIFGVSLRKGVINISSSKNESNLADHLRSRRIG